MLRAMATARWATLDCYGTLVDWNAGIGTELADLTGLADVLDELGRRTRGRGRSVVNAGVTGARPPARRS